jgi:26S proteasome regulatory subunit N2
LLELIEKDEKKEEIEEEKKDEKKEEKKKKKEENFEILTNFTRVAPQQLRYVEFKQNARFDPVKKGSIVGGIMVMVDRTPAEPVELIPFKIPGNKMID